MLAPDISAPGQKETLGPRLSYVRSSPRQRTWPHVCFGAKAEATAAANAFCTKKLPRHHPVDVLYRRSTWNDLAVISQASFMQWYER
jgi:hypothetical protein